MKKKQLQCKFNKNVEVFIKDAFENVLCKMMAILFWPQRFNMVQYDAPYWWLNAKEA